jgi:hypothetical protein
MNTAFTAFTAFTVVNPVNAIVYSRYTPFIFKGV